MRRTEWGVILMRVFASGIALACAFLVLVFGPQADAPEFEHLLI
jgi:hypothetical protein